MNRVVGSDGSSILGTLSSNGRVFLVNPNGVIFGPGARIDTAAFIASTLNIADSDFLQGRLKFEGGGNGVLRNEGTIRASGDIMLVGPRIENAGLIRSGNGSVLLAAGQKLTITSPDAQGVKFELQAPSDSALNVGAIQAHNAVGMFAGTLRHSGDISVTTATGAGGRVALVAQKDATIDKDATISASGLSGGSVTIQSGDTTLVAGRIEATGSAEQGGAVHVLGDKVGILSGANINASGETGGGTILVGGDYQGRNASIANASQTVVQADATLRADAIGAGNGGKVIVWANDIARFEGSISARGGAAAGDGGFAEVSGKAFLDFRGRVDTRAPHGRTGTLLLDPTDIEFVEALGGVPPTQLNGGIFQETGVTPPLLSQITPGALSAALSGTDVVISTESTAAAPGDIRWNTPFNYDGGNSRTLTLNANRNIDFNNSIASALPGALAVFVNSAGATNVASNIALAGGTVGALNVTAGNLTLNGPVSAGQINLSGGVLDVATGFLPRLNMTGGVLTRSAPGDLVVGGPFNIEGGFIAPSAAVGDLVTLGPTTVVASRTVTTSRHWANAGILNLNGEIVLSGANFTNQQPGTLNVTGAGRMDLAGAILANAGMLTLDTALANEAPFGAAPGGPIINSGTINKNGGGLVNLVHPLQTQPTSRINVNAGTLSAAFGGTHSGATQIESGATLNTDGAMANAPNSVIGGAGTLQLFGGTLTNFGLVRAGSASAPGTLTIAGSFTNDATGAVDLRLGGTTPGAFDTLSITNTATLAGTLNVTAMPGFAPADGDTFNVLTAAARVGQFDTINKTFSTGLNAVYGATNLLLSLGPPTLNVWLFDLDGLWNSDANWSLGHIPTSGEQVVINRPGTPTITVPAGGDFTVSSLKSNENLTVAGALTLSTASTVDAALAVNGGTVTANGALTINGALAVNSGTVQGSGPVAVNGALSLNAGTLAGPGAVTVNGNTAVDTGASQLAGTLITNMLTMPSGSLNVAPGGALTLAGPGVSTIGAATLTNAGTLRMAASANLFLNSGAVLSNSNSGTFDIAGSGDVLVSGGALLENFGSLNLSGPGHIILDGGPSRLANRASGTLNDLSSNTTPVSAPAVTAAVFDNAGTFNKGAGSAATQTIDAPFNNTGLVNVSTGTLNLSRGGTDTGVYALPAGSMLDMSGGTRIVSSGIAFTGPGTIRLSGGALDVQSGNLPRLDMAGGVLSRTTPGDVVIDGAFNVSGGAIFLTPLAELVTTGTTTVTNTVNPISSWRNTGTIDLNAGQISPSPGSGFVLTNQGTLNLNTPDAKPFSDPTGSQIVNSGVINKNAPVASDFSNAFTNLASGTLNVNVDKLTLPLSVTQSGTIRINSGATLSTGGNALTNLAGARIGGSGTIDLGAATLTNAGALQPGGTATNTAGTGTLSIVGNLVQGPTGVVDVQLAGTAPGTFSALSVSGNAALAGTLNLSTIGGYTPAIGDTFDVLTAGSRSGIFALTNKTFANEIIPTYGPTNLSLLAGSVTGNTWILDAGDLWTNPAAWSQGHVPLATEQVVIDRPAGLFTLTVPAGAAVSVGSVTSNETINVAGTLGVGNASTINAALGVTGTVQGAGAVTVNGALSLTGGTIASTGGITVSGTTTVDTAASQISGKLSTVGLNVASGSLAVSSGGVLTLEGAGAKTIGSAVLTNAGTATVGGTANLVLGNGAQVTNTGTFVLASDAGIQSAAGAAVSLTNSGTVLKTAGVESAIAIAAPGAFTNSGTLDAQVGRLTYAGNNVFNSGTVFSGAGAHAVTGNSLFNGAITSTNLILQSGDFGGAANFSGAQTWTGGRMTGTFTINPGATLDIARGAAKTFDPASAFLTNNGTINVGTAQAIDAPFSNAGTVNVNAGTLTLAGNGTDTGSFATTAGTTLEVTGGTRNFDAGIALSGGGTVRLSGGTLNANTPLVQAAGGPALQVTGGVLNNTSGLAVNGSFAWSGGTVTGTGTLTTAAGSNTAVTGAVNLADTTWNNAGTIDLSGSGSVVLSGGGGVATTLRNAAGGIINDSSASVAPVTTGATTRLNKSFVNAGTFNKLAGSAASQTLDVPLTNSGTLDVQSGTLLASAFPINDGKVIIGAGATLATGGTALANAAGSTLQGNGTLDVGAATLTNSGTVAPGDTPGTLTIAGNFTQTAAGNLKIDIDGTAQGVTYDLLRVTGIASLGGIVDVTLAPGFVPAAGGTFDFMTYAANIGDFGIVRTPAAAALQLAPLATSYRATATTATTATSVNPPDSTVFTDTNVRALLVLSDRSLAALVPQETIQDDRNWTKQQCR
ncbi:MAG TPA: filamentous hemagglutinin N-terminal domain-containing protein [Burkholderiales bacterium]|nr:filamentous hemagglutinin N-terminal domain-containing protein [Burkholderiales bacterium]